MKIKCLLLSFILLLSMALSACSTGNNVSSQPPAIDSNGASSQPSSAASSEPDGNTAQNTGAQGERYLNLTLNGTETVTAVLVDSPAAEEFLTQLPLTINMHEHLIRQKEVYLDFSLSEESQTNTVHEYEIGDIVYWHPGPTIGIFYDHDGRSISSGIEVLARLDAAGIEAFANTTDDVEVLIELGTTGGATNTQGGRHLNLTFDGTDVFTAALIESPATEEFLTHLPLTLNMTDYLNREKHAGLPFSIAEENLTNIQTPYEIGDVIYYPPGPTFAMYYDHDGREISAGMEVIARLDDAAIAALAERSGAVDVTIEIAE